MFDRFPMHCEYSLAVYMQKKRTNNLKTQNTHDVEYTCNDLIVLEHHQPFLGRHHLHRHQML